MIIESKPTAIRSGIDLPALIIALEITLGHAVAENLVLDPFGRLKPEVELAAAGLLIPIEKVEPTPPCCSLVHSNFLKYVTQSRQW